MRQLKCQAKWCSVSCYSDSLGPSKSPCLIQFDLTSTMLRTLWIGMISFVPDDFPVFFLHAYTPSFPDKRALRLREHGRGMKWAQIFRLQFTTADQQSIAAGKDLFVVSSVPVFSMGSYIAAMFWKQRGVRSVDRPTVQSTKSNVECGDLSKDRVIITHTFGHEQWVGVPSLDPFHPDSPTKQTKRKPLPHQTARWLGLLDQRWRIKPEQVVIYGHNNKPKLAVIGDTSFQRGSFLQQWPDQQLRGNNWPLALNGSIWTLFVT